MKYSILINQIGAHNAGLSDEIDIIDLAVFDAFKDFANSNRCQKKIHNGRVYFWIDYNLVIRELPRVPLKTKDSVYRRMKKLSDAGIIEFHPDNQRTGKSFFCWGRNYDALILQENVHTSGFSSVPPTDNYPDPSGFSSVPPTDNYPDNQYTINQYTNHTTNNHIPADAESDPSHVVVIFEENEPTIIEPVYLNTEKKKPKSTGREKSDGSGSWTRKIAELFDRVEVEESHRAGIQSVPFAWQMNAGRNFSVLKSIRQQIEKDIAAKQNRPATEDETETGFEAMFRFGFRYLNSIAEKKGGLPQYSPATILNNYTSIKRYATSSSNKNSVGRTAEFYRSAAEIDLGIE